MVRVDKEKKIKEYHPDASTVRWTKKSHKLLQAVSESGAFVSLRKSKEL